MSIFVHDFEIWLAMTLTVSLVVIKLNMKYDLSSVLTGLKSLTTAC